MQQFPPTVESRNHSQKGNGGKKTRSNMTKQGKTTAPLKGGTGRIRRRKMSNTKKGKDVSNVCHFRQSSAAASLTVATLPWRLLSKHIIIIITTATDRRRTIRSKGCVGGVCLFVCISTIKHQNSTRFFKTTLFHRHAKCIRTRDGEFCE